ILVTESAVFTFIYVRRARVIGDLTKVLGKLVVKIHHVIKGLDTDVGFPELNRKLQPQSHGRPDSSPGIFRDGVLIDELTGLIPVLYPPNEMGVRVGDGGPEVAGVDVVLIAYEYPSHVRHDGPQRSL